MVTNLLSECCYNEVLHTPTCADPLWKLYNTTLADDYLCCLSDQIGVKPDANSDIGSCVPGGAGGGPPVGIGPVGTSGTISTSPASATATRSSRIATTNSGSSSSGLSRSAIGGIVGGAVCSVLVIAALILLFVRRNKGKHESQLAASSAKGQSVESIESTVTTTHPPAAPLA
ncbi:hypothetical protein FGG08_002270 [Glutinoglossum americanum]|uniref:Extracellular membrane protein CFEM domain-containing protein n=1 Tax=Glutinoglossum americanum TaxID=1670608 RepID=A0A9P8L5Q7_9PEZI|nr:hypothetical protein FGG08_002270 [Glutinoglossum americanum]